MKNNKQLVKLVESNQFTYLIISVILLNAVLIGIELSNTSAIILNLQHACLVVFIIEIFIRWFGRVSTKTYVQDWWNWFDIAIVLISFFPEGNPDNVAIYTAFRIIRVFRVLRLFKVFPGLGRMSLVLVKSLSSLTHAIFLLLIFMYLYALIGVILFKGEIMVHNSYDAVIDPFGNIGEAFFSLFRVTTGEDWTDLRYDLMQVGIDHFIINFYYVSWMILSAFLFLNIIIGAVVNNYENEYNRERANDVDDKINSILEKLDKLNSK